MLHTIQSRLAGDALDHAGGVGAGRRQRAAHTRGGKHVPLLQRAREPAVEERMQRLEAARAAAADGGAAAADGGAAEVTERQRELVAV